MPCIATVFPLSTVPYLRPPRKEYRKLSASLAVKAPFPQPYTGRSLKTLSRASIRPISDAYPQCASLGSSTMANLGVPVKLLHESLGHVITVELKTGEVISRCLREVSR